jgi:hypothetical protein
MVAVTQKKGYARSARLTAVASILSHLNYFCCLALNVSAISFFLRYVCLSCTLGSVSFIG